MFDAPNYFDPPNQPKPPLRQNQFGGVLGGPVVRDRSFFFASYEGQRVRRSLTRTFSVPSQAVRGGDFSGLGQICDPVTINPATGGYTYPTMSCEIQLFNSKESTKAHRHTSSALYHCFKGQGRTKVGEGYLEWRKGDTFVVPLWQWHAHENLGNDEAILFSLNDRPVMEALQLYREEAGN